MTVYIPEIPSLRFDRRGKLLHEIEEKNLTMIPHIVPEFNAHDGNVFAMWASPPFPYHNSPIDHPEYKTRTDRIYDYILSNIRDENTKIFFDNLWEGHTLSALFEIYAIVDKLQLNPKNCYFFTGGLQIKDHHKQFCEERGISEEKQIHVYGVNIWEYNTFKTSEYLENAPYKPMKREKLFLCFNRMTRPHRTAIMALLLNADIIKDSYYSFYAQGYAGADLGNDFYVINKYCGQKTVNIVKQTIEKNKHLFPMELNLYAQSENANYVKKQDWEYYNNSYFSIVTETFFFPQPFYGGLLDSTSVFFSEKIFKPICCKHPFILASRPYSLEYLKKLGYKTFAPFIDERYDLEEDDAKRLLMIIEEIKRLSKFTDDEWMEWQRNVAEIVEHNFRVLTTRKKDEYVI